MAAATTIETTETTQTTAPANRWDKVHATITNLRGQVTSRVDDAHTDVDAEAGRVGDRGVAHARGALGADGRLGDRDHDVLLVGFRE